MTEPNTNQPKQIKCKTWLNKWFSQFQQVSVHGPDCSRSRGNCGTEEQDRCLFLGFCLESGPISPHLPPTLMGCSDAVAPEGVMERMPERVWPLSLALGASFPHLRHEGFVIMRSRGYKGNNIVPVTLEVPHVRSWPGMFRDSLSCFFPTSSSGLLFDIVAAGAIALLVRGALWEGKLVHLGRLLFHAEERLCVRGQKQRSREPAMLLFLLLLTSGAAIFIKRIHVKKKKHAFQLIWLVLRISVWDV